MRTMPTVYLQGLILLGLLSFITVYGCPGRTMINANEISDYDKQVILEMHNKMRQALALGQVTGQPPAANMQEMRWDDELAYKAQSWALSCSSERHDDNRHIGRFLVGQNIATKWTTREPKSYYDALPDFQDAISKWFNEVNRYRFQSIGLSNSLTGHYTQMIWADTNLVGCGYAFYYDSSKGFTKNYVCNYGPGGNVITRTPYEKGRPSCVNYGLQDSLKYIGLCDKLPQYQMENYSSMRYHSTPSNFHHSSSSFQSNFHESHSFPHSSSTYHPTNPFQQFLDITTNFLGK